MEEIYAGRSEIRNKIIARIFREAGIIEQWGSGIPRMREVCQQKGLKAPELSEDGMFVKLTIYRKVNKFLVYEKNEIGYKAVSKNSEILKEKERILVLLHKNPNYTVKELADTVGISQAAAQRRLEGLQKEKKIKRIGSKKSGKWKVLS